MNYGLQLAASGALTSLYRMDVLANNLANMGTVGFKPDIPGVRQRDTARIETGGYLPSNKLLERLGGGVMSAPNRINFDQGPLSQSSNALDTGIQGDGFFVVRDEGGTARLTRDGRFTQDALNRLVSATSGSLILDVANRPITLRPDAPIEIQPNGIIRQGGETVAQIQLSTPPDTAALQKLGQGLFQASPEDMKALKAASGKIQQHFLEGSAVDPITALMAITAASKAAESNFSLIKSHDHLLDRAINSLGRVA